MKGLMTLVLAVGLVLGVGNVYALDPYDALIHQWVSGGEYTEPSLIPTGLAAGVRGPVLFTQYVDANISHFLGQDAEETIALDNGFAMEKMVADALGVSVTDVANRSFDEGGILAIYAEQGIVDLGSDE